MRVEASHITKAMVSPYFGKEIPGWESLGLDGNKIYNLLRCPIELEKAAPSFTNLPLLIIHKGTTADNHDKQVVVGTVGAAQWVAPFIDASLSVWTEEAIAAIESGQQAELSCGYRYRPDMTPGTYEGQPYDGVMRDIMGNHVALVEVGRAGSDVVVADASPFFLKGNEMKLTPQAYAVAGALRVYLTPKLAQDAAIGDLSALVATVTAKDFAKQTAGVVTAVKTKFGAKLAADAKLDDLHAMLAPLAMDAETDEEKKDTAEDGIGDDDDEMEDDPEKPGEKRKKKKVGAEDEPGDNLESKLTYGKRAMDAQINKRVAAEVAKVSAKMAQDSNELAIAKREVLAIVGDVDLPTAGAVYQFALDHLKIDTMGATEANAMRAMLAMHKSAQATPRVHAATMGLDSATVKATGERFTDLNRFKHI